MSAPTQPRTPRPMRAGVLYSEAVAKLRFVHELIEPRQGVRVTADVFDFYPCMVDRAPASIYINLRYAHEQPPAGFDVQYTFAIQLRDRGSYGIGSADEAAVLDAFEEVALPAAAARGLVFVGRLRHRGVWELTFYGLPGAQGALETLERASLAGRDVITRSQPDADWSYYRELLLPDTERLRWMDDRRLVQILGEQGDVLTRPRRIDHRASFPSRAARDGFLADAACRGFAVDASHPETHEVAGAFVARVHRADPVELEHVHDVVMILVDIALARRGEYDGWTAAIES